MTGNRRPAQRGQARSWSIAALPIVLVAIGPRQAAAEAPPLVPMVRSQAVTGMPRAASEALPDARKARHTRARRHIESLSGWSRPWIPSWRRQPELRAPRQSRLPAWWRSSPVGGPALYAFAGPCSGTEPLSIWEAVDRGCATFRQDPPSFGQPILYPASVGSALFIQLASQAAGPIVVEGDEFVFLTDEGAQDAFLHVMPRDTRTAGYWSNWENHFTEEFMARFVQWVNEDSILFGPGELYGEVTTDNAHDLLKVRGGSTALEKLRRQLLATWLDIEASYVPINARIEPAAISGAEALLGTAPRALHVDPVSKPPTENLRGGVIGTIEELVDGGGLTKSEILVLKDVLDAINNDRSDVVVDGLVIEPEQTYETLIAQRHVASTYARISEMPDLRQPPGLAAVWLCTEGLSLSQGVAPADFGPGGEIIPDALRDLVDDLRFGVVGFTDVAMPPRMGTDRVRLTVGRRVYDFTVEYDGSEAAEDQFLRFVDTITRGTGIEVITRRLDRFGFTWRYAILRSTKHWKLENIESAGPAPWLNSGMAWVSPDVYAAYGEPAQYLVWFHLEDHPAVLIGKTPLYGSPPHTVRIRVTNIGLPHSGPITVTDTVPAGLEADSFSVEPDSMVSLPTGEQTLTWELPPLDGSMVGGIHPSQIIEYSLDGSVAERTVVPGAIAEWDGQMSRSADVVLVP